jgi:hypothetical protein
MHSSQAEKTILLSVLDVLPGCSNPEVHTYQDKYGLLQGLRHLQSDMPGSGYNHGLAKKRSTFGKKNQQNQYSIAGRQSGCR